MAFPCSISSWCGCFLIPPPSRISLVFLTLMFMRLAADWVTMWSGLSCILLCWSTPSTSLSVVSSTNLYTWHSAVKSFISTRNVSGPSQDPCGIAPVSVVQSDMCLPTTTRCWRPLRKEQNHRVVQGPSISLLQQHGLHGRKLWRSQ